MAGIVVNPGETILLSYQAADEDATLTVTVKIYKNDSTQLGTDISLTHVAGGLYTSTTTINDEGTYTARYDPADADRATSVETISVQRSWRPSFGQAEATVDPKQIKMITEPIEKRLERIEEELKQKSEFDPDKQKVKTDISIPPVSFRAVNDRLDNFNNLIKQLLKAKDYTLQFKEIKNQIDNIPKVDLAFLNTGLNKIGEQINQIKFPEISEVDLSPIANQIDSLNQQQKKNSVEIKENLSQTFSQIKKTLTGVSDKLIGGLGGFSDNLQIRVQIIVSDLNKVLSHLEAVGNKLNSKSDELKNISQLINSLTQFKNNFTTIENLLEVLNQETGKRNNKLVGLVKEVLMFLRIKSKI